MRSEVRFGSFLVYSPRGQTEESRKSRRITYAVKDDRPGPQGAPMIDYVVRRLRETDPAELRGLFGPSTTLVPVPRSCLMKPDTLWVPARICQRLVAEGLARETVPCLVRATELPRSAGATVRPSASEHYDSLAVERDLLVASVGPMTLVDDVVTRGATLLAAVSLLEESFAGTDVRALALIRTMSAGEVESVLSPCVGTIKDRGGNRLRREP